jgi:transketolase
MSVAVDVTTVDAPFASALLALGKRREDVVVLSADLSKYTDVLPFAEEFPDRFLQVGMAEANMMGIAGGLAKTGFLPIAVTYGVFATRRAYDQVAMALSTGPSRGIVVAFLPGITTPFKATHQAIDDLALMRALPGMTVVDPADATELTAAVEFAVAATGPVYIRGMRATVPKLFDDGGFELRAREVLTGGEIALITTGLGYQWALEAAQLLGERRVSVLHVPVLKPLDVETVCAFCAGFESVTTIENHSIMGGLGTAVSEAVAARGMPTRVQRLGVPDRWAPAGSLDYIRRELGLDAAGIAEAVR